MRLATVDPAVDPAWTELLGRPGAGLFHAPPWLAALRQTYGLAPTAAIVEGRAGEKLAGLAYCDVVDLLGRRILSLPFSDACDPLVESAPAWELLFRSLTSHGVPVRLRCLDNPIVLADRRLTVAKRARWHTLGVAASEAAQWSGLAGSTRRAIRKAERSGVVVAPLAGADGLREFHRLHVALRKRKYRLFAQPPAFFESLRRQFNAVDGWFPLGARLDQRLIGAALFLRWGDTLFYKFNASALDSLAARPNSLLVWAGVARARSLGCSRLDLGPSDDDQPGLIRFKRNFGAAERELCVLDHVPPGWRDDRADELRQLLGRLTTLLTAAEMSDDITAEAGTLLYRYFA